MDGWAVTPAGQVVIPPLFMNEIARAENNKVHRGTENLV